MKSVIKAATMRSFSGYAIRLTEMLKKETGEMVMTPTEEGPLEEEEPAMTIESEEGEPGEIERREGGKLMPFDLLFMLKNKLIYYGLALIVLILSIAFYYHIPLFRGKSERGGISSSSFTPSSLPKVSEWLDVNLRIKYGIIHSKHEQLSMMQTQLEDLLIQIKNNKERLNEKREMIVKAELLIECYSNANKNVKECEMMEKKWLLERNRKL
jgi:hypothetical protein